ncbi:Aste57867_7930 [Aphanomyces stellatus]|uniref:Elongator complex protein 1 n=1 Tax=Aphanomyces stellatus TaxID=120398 RepID=A0A485KJ09_9STRA|nr:hypothetical protein As57867_007900 [Aphanomyces stellatus]VFT84823.1 Aste57867_7930 [Aphanomyces stellatus]
MRNLVVLSEQRHALHPSSWVDMSMDPAEDRIWCLSASGHLVGLVDGLAVLDVDLPTQADWSWCEYHAELDGVVCASRSGCLAFVKYPNAVDVIGHFDFGICGVAWSPNEEQLALVTGDGHFLTMNTTWDVLHESSCAASPLGSGAMVQLAWRADGNFLALQGPFLDPTSLQLQIWAVQNAVWTQQAIGRHEDKKPLLLHGTGLSWASNHTLIGSSERFKNQLHVVFFERNGLRHGEFALDKSIAAVSHVEWNLSSDVVAVAATLDATNATHKAVVQLWTRSNYHWYLKQERRMSSPVSALRWDLEQADRLHVLTTDGQYIDMNMTRQIHGNAHGTVAVVDGRALKVTHCARALIPPPMCAETFVFAHPINNVAVMDNGVLVVGDASGQWYSASKNQSIESNEAMTMQPLGLQEKPLHLLQVVPIGHDKVVGISTEASDVVVTLDLTQLTTTTTEYPEAISTLSQDGRYVQLQSKRIESIPDVTVPCLFSQWAVLHAHESVLCVGLSHSKLYVNDRLLHASTASFHVMHGYVMMTTLGSHPEFHLYRVEALCHAQYAPEHVRPVERGAKVVTSTATDVYLQMPRGNIEGIAPRPLLLELLQSQLDQRQYAPALELCRKHRVDMNLLVDTDPNSFLSNVLGLVEGIPKRLRCDRLSLFLTNLHPVNVCATKYPTMVVREGKPLDWDKAHAVCMAVRTCLLGLDTNFYLMPLLTCEAKMNLLEPALHRLQVLHKTQPALAQKGLQHLVFLVDVELLYDVALGLYDVGLTRLVASHTQRDPKVYTPQLAAFEALEASHSTMYMQYAIDVHLERFDKALLHLHAAGESYRSQCLDLIRTHHLYDAGLALFPSSSTLYTDIVVAFGHHLASQKEFTRAGYTFLSIRHVEDAIEAFRYALDWKMVLALAPRVPSLSIPSLAYGLAEALVQHTDPNPVDAARLYDEYCNDIDEAITTLINGRLYQEALQMALRRARSDLIDTDIQPAVEQAADDLVDELETKVTTYKKQWTRLTSLRDQIRLFRLHGIDGKGEDDADGGHDTASSAASALSQSSVASSVGSHNTNRDIKFGFLEAATQGAAITSSFYANSLGGATPASSGAAPPQKKVARRFRRNKIKQGSAEEDAYVEKTLLAAIPTTEELQEAKTVLQLLLYFGQVKTVQTIQRAIRSCLDHMAAHPPPPPVHVRDVSFVVSSRAVFYFKGDAPVFHLPTDVPYEVLSPSI